MSAKEPPKGASTRAEAARVVHDVVAGGRSLDAALADAEPRVASDERALLRAIAYGVLRAHWRLSADVDRLLTRPLRRRDRIIHSLLAVGIYQLGDLRVPAHAAVTLTVDAARRLKRPRAAALVNAVLRGYQRTGDTGRPVTDEIRFDHPQWMIDRLRDDWPDHWRSILEANNRQAPMWLRVNARRTTAAGYLERLTVPGSLLPGFDHAIRLEKPCPVADLPGFDDGDVSVQDAGAQLAAPWLLENGGTRLLDLCAAPGGKAAHLLELACDNASLTAVERDPARAVLVEATMQRLGFDAGIRVADASDLSAWWDGRPFDRVLLDAPCSASGVIRRHPDIKHLRRPGDIDALSSLQASLIEAAWDVLVPGGRLLYVTCSVLRAENDLVIGDFLDRHRDAQAKHVLPNNNIQALMVPCDHGFQVLPGSGGLDGFYFACIDRRA